MALNSLWFIECISGERHAVLATNALAVCQANCL